MGNDGCVWQLKCDPKTTNAACPYDQAYAQSHRSSARCRRRSRRSASTSCRKLTPNGCDCFGCCTVPGRADAVRLVPTCTAADFGDPIKCPRCTQVAQCMTPCGHCEYCIGKTTLPADCATDGGTPYTCPEGYIACGQYGVPATQCPTDTTCVTGCCRPIVP